MSAYGVQVNDTTVRFERLLPGPIERVFAFLWDEDKRRLWFTSGAMPTTTGTSFDQRWKHSEYSPIPSEPPERMQEVDRTGHTATNTLLAYEPPHRLAYTFGQGSEVEFVLKPEGGQVRLVLTHSKLPNRDYTLNISGGWHSHLDVLEYQLRGETPPGFWDVWRKVEGVYDKRYA
jgi:uncharacterized protein YndB with AHSA1/START domain